MGIMDMDDMVTGMAMRPLVMVTHRGSTAPIIDQDFMVQPSIVRAFMAGAVGAGAVGDGAGGVGAGGMVGSGRLSLSQLLMACACPLRLVPRTSLSAGTPT